MSRNQLPMISKIYTIYIRQTRPANFMGVAWVGILPRQETGGSVPQKLSTLGGGGVKF